MSSNSRITADRAKADYLAMGPQRSVAKLVKLLGERGEDASGKTLEMWCAKYGWVRAAEEHDAQVAGEVSRRAIEAQAEQTWDAVQELTECVELAVGRIKRALPGLPVESVADAKGLADVMLALLKAAGELQRGETTATQAQAAVDEAAEGLNVIELWERRHAGND